MTKLIIVSGQLKGQTGCHFLARSHWQFRKPTFFLDIKSWGGVNSIIISKISDDMY
jgi:hypothetical protein